MQAILFIGIQGSGKSSFFKERFYDTHVRISRDLLKTEHREREFIDTCLRTKQPFVIDKINVRRAQRAEYITLARDAGFKVIGYYFPCTTREAVARNNLRTGPAKVPLVGIFSAYKQMEEPSPTEGFAELFRVVLSAENRFEVSAWNATP